MRLAYVVQRYGPEIVGGAESHCRSFATRLVERGHDVEVFTTCASDYRTWRNTFPAGQAADSGVVVRRFQVAQERALDFDGACGEVFAHPRTTPLALQEEWMHKQGPQVPELIEALRKEAGRFDLVVFVTYLYWTTYFGLPVAHERAVLQPTAHNESPIYMSMFDALFRSPRALVFLSEEEKSFVHRRFPVPEIPQVVAGVGLGPPPRVDAERGRKLAGASKYAMYLGRIDLMKGIDHACSFFATYRERRGGDLELLLVGDPVTDVPGPPGVRVMGVVNDQDKWDLLAGADVLIQPSFYESFALSLLEAWSLGVPVVVNGFCDVTKRHCQKSGGGLWYRSYMEFESCMERLCDNESLRRQLGEHGRNYVEAAYIWDRIIEGYECFLGGVRSAL